MTLAKRILASPLLAVAYGLAVGVLGALGVIPPRDAVAIGAGIVVHSPLAALANRKADA